MVNIEKEEFLKLYGFEDEFSYELFKHFIQYGVEPEDIEDWLWNPFDFEDPNFILSFPDDHNFDKNEISYEDALTFDRANKAYGRDKKIDFLLKE